MIKLTDEKVTKTQSKDKPVTCIIVVSKVFCEFQKVLYQYRPWCASNILTIHRIIENLPKRNR